MSRTTNAHNWTADEEDYLVNNYLKANSYDELAKHLGLTTSQVKNKLQNMGYFLPKQELNKRMVKNGNLLPYKPKIENIEKRINEEIQLILKYYPEKLYDIFDRLADTIKVYKIIVKEESFSTNHQN